MGFIFRTFPKALAQHRDPVKHLPLSSAHLLQHGQGIFIFMLF